MIGLTVLNKAQAQELAKFFFDIGKGLILGGVGFATVGSIEIRIITAILSLALSYTCIRFGLTLLKEVK